MGYGIGRIPQDVDQSAENLAELKAIEINRKQEQSWDEICWRESSCVECEIHDGIHTQISRRVYCSGTAGSRVMCEKHWLEHNARHGKTFEEVMGKLIELSRQERARIKHCAKCGSTNATWNSGAGRDLCPRHWDEY